MSDWDEKEHPRDEYGKFVDKNNIQNNQIPYPVEGTPAERKKLRELGYLRNEKTQTELWGKEYVGYKGQLAVEKLLKEMQGHVK